MTPFDWNDDKSIWEDLERAERMVRREKARTALQDASEYDDKICELRCEKRSLIRENDGLYGDLSTLRLVVWGLSVACLILLVIVCAR
jgi:hypothetical protein